MTLIAAFRCRDTGILLCADRQEDDGISKRPFDKLYRIGELPHCQVLIAGSGTTSAITDSRNEIHNALILAVQSGADILQQHRSIIEQSLKKIHARHKQDLKTYPLGLLIVILPRAPKSTPFFYRSDKENLIPEDNYYAYGSGAPLSDYFSHRLYRYGLSSEAVLTLAAFILREAEEFASGVGLGNDMVLTCPSGTLNFLHKESVAEIQRGIDGLGDIFYSHWEEHVESPKWLKNYAACEPTEPDASNK